MKMQPLSVKMFVGVMIGFVITLLLVWLVSGWVTFGEPALPMTVSQRLVLLMGVVVCLLLVGLGVSWWRDRKSLADGMNAQAADTQRKNAAATASAVDRATKKPALQGFKQSFHQVVKLAEKQRRQRGLNTQQPWYLVLGAAGSGKTTLLQQSGIAMHPVIGSEGDEGLTDHLWWLSDEAVFIDAPGQWLAPNSQSDTDPAHWSELLALLQSHRPSQPLNGIILTVSAQDLLVQPEDDHRALARALRARLRELTQTLAIRVPVYLVLSKCDLIAGFAELFDDLTGSEREQVWGVTLPEEALASDSVVMPVNSGMNGLMKRLHNRMLARLQRVQDLHRRSILQAFPAQMAVLGKQVERIVQGLMMVDPRDAALAATTASSDHEALFSRPPMFRGFYLTSAVQKGAPIDRVTAKTVARFGVDQALVANQAMHKRAHFIRELFSQLILPEAGLVGANEQVERWIAMRVNAGLAAAALLGVGLIAWWGMGAKHHQQTLRAVAVSVTEFGQQEQQLVSSQEQPSAALPALKQLQDGFEQLERARESRWLGWFVQDSAPDEHLNALYQRALVGHLLPRLMTELGDYLLTRTAQDTDLLPSLRVYRMLANSENRDAEVVQRWWDEYWQVTSVSYVDQSKKAQPAVRQDSLAETVDAQGESGQTIESGQTAERDQTQNIKHLQRHLAALLRQPNSSAPLDQAVVEHTRALFEQIPQAQRVYAQLQQHDNMGRMVDIQQQVPTELKTLFGIEAQDVRWQIPRLYTRDGFKSVDLTADSAFLQRATQDNDALSDQSSQANDQKRAGELTALGQQVEALYLRDYINTWQRLLGTLELQPLGNMTTAARRIGVLADPVGSPLVAILQASRVHTQLTPQAANLLAKVDKGTVPAGVAGELTGAAERFQVSNSVDTTFAKLNALVGHGDQTALNNVMTALSDLNAQLSELASADDAGESAFNYAKQRMLRTASNDPIRTLRIETERLPMPVRGWLLDVVAQSWGLVLADAKRYVDQQWQAQVHAHYAAHLGGRYPMQSSAEREVSLARFTEYFKPGGIEAAFVNEYLRPFIDVQRWSAKSVDGQSLGFKSSTLARLRQAQMLRSMYFGKDARLALGWSVKPIKLDAQAQAVDLFVGQQQVRYSHGPRFATSVKWPANGSDSVSVQFQDLAEQRFNQRFDGEWALFRAMDTATINNTEKTDVIQAVFSGPQEHRVEYEFKSQSVDNPFNQRTVLAYVCPERL